MAFAYTQGWALTTYVAEVAFFVVFGIMTEPFGWGVVLGACLLGGARQPWWSTLLLAAGSTVCGFTLLYLWQRQTGIPPILPTWLDFLALYVSFCAICGIGWVLGRAAARLVHKADRPVMINSKEAP
jgi:hypothetical protein